MLVVAVLTILSSMNSTKDRMWVNHTHVVLETLESLEIAVLDAETFQRAFLLTGDNSYLTDYQSALDGLRRKVQDLRELTADNPHQQEAVNSLDALIDAKVANLGSHVRARVEEGLESGIAAVEGGSGSRLTKQVRTAVSRMKQEEERLLAIRTGELEVSSRNTRFMIVAGETLGLVFLFAAGLVIHQEMRKRAQSEAEVRTLNAGLEQRVAERTAELAERAKELERSNRELQQFAYVASHDLQEPLRTISSFTQLLAKRYRERLDDKAREFIDFAVDGCKRMQAQINDLLAFSRVGTQGKPLLTVDSDAALDRVLRSMKVGIEEAKAMITRDPLPSVLADETQLCQLFQNLIANAIKFRGSESPRIHVSAQKDPGGWTFSVRDNGIGIASEHSERIFVIFQRLHTKAEYPGTGIGLAICKKIAERHGGRIWFEPSPGGGTTFCFTIHAAQPSIAQTRGPHELRLTASAD